MESTETNISIIKGAGWEVVEYDMEPSLDGPVACVTDDGEFLCQVKKQHGAPRAYTAVSATGVNKEGEEVHLANAYDRLDPMAAKLRAACYDGMVKAIRELLA
jgi:hypothetical protein